MAKNPVGRPGEYRKDIHPQMVLNYLKESVDEYPGMRKITRIVKGKKKVEYEKTRFKVNLPTIEECSLVLDINVDTIYDWCRKYPEFSEVIERLKATQASRLVRGGVSGDYNSTITKLILHKHGYRDAQEITGAEGKDLIPDNESREKSSNAISTFLTKKKK